jgi:hypothetical protein
MPPSLPLALWLNLARSGGTLIGRCLGCMDGVALLSEVHPLGVKMIDPAEQARRWHTLLKPAEMPAWRGGRGRYDQLIALLAARTRAQGKALLLRDWSHLDFLGVPFTEPGFTSRSSQLLESSFELHRFVTVRHPADQWASQQRLDMLRGRVEPAIYLRGCRAFAELAVEVGFVRFEDFTTDPDAGLVRLCAGLGVGYDPAWRDRYRTFAHITGDEEALAKAIGEIRPARRHTLDPATRTVFESSDDYAETRTPTQP